MITLPRSACRNDWDAFCLTHPNGWFWHTNAWLDYCLEYTPDSKDYNAVSFDERGIAILEPLITLDDRPVGGGRPLAPRLVRDQLLTNPPPLSQVIELATWTPADIRKSYRGLVRQQCEEFNFSIVDHRMFWKCIYTNIMAMREVHATEAGRYTRSAKTWGMMAEWITTGKGCAILAHDWNLNLVGFAYAIIYKSKAYYASGAIMQDCGHAIQYKLIKYLKQRGIHYYELGEQGTATTEKECAIEFFKRGFGGCCSTTAEH